MSSSIDTPAALRIRVGKDLCCGAQLCVAAAPGVYRLDERGYNASDGDLVPAGQEAQAERGRRACPEQAIRLLDESGGTPRALPQAGKGGPVSKDFSARCL